MLEKYPDTKIVCIDCLTYAGNMSTLAKAMENPNFKFYKTNICDRAGIYKIFEEEKPDVIVLGYPLLENGDEGPRASLSREFGEQLEIESGIKVVLQDERCTTKDSEEFLISAGVSRKKRKKVIDQQAAVRILQYYLDSLNNAK